MGSEAGVRQTASGVLAARIRAAAHVNPYLCYQCMKCSTGCPVAPFADVHPAQVVRAVQLGDEGMSVGSRLIWLCTGCETCTTRCPQGIDVAAIMDGLRAIAREDGRVRADMPSARLLDLNYRSFTRWGRLYELELVARDLFRRPKAALHYLRLGSRMFARGRVRFLPAAAGRGQMRQMVRAAEQMQKQRSTAAKAATPGTAPGGGSGEGATHA